MIFKPEDDNQDNDYFDGPDLPDTPEPEVPKEPTFQPDDPRYWEREESEWEHLRPARKPRIMVWIWLGAGLLAIALVWAVWLRYFSPYVEDADQFGYVDSIERRGTIFSTYEGVLIPYKNLMDTTRVYDRDFVFTVKADSVAVKLKKMQIASRPVRVTYRRYHATVPWRGASTVVVTAVDSVDPGQILPPEFAPPVHARND